MFLVYEEIQIYLKIYDTHQSSFFSRLQQTTNYLNLREKTIRQSISNGSSLYLYYLVDK
jgi:hypothetical protein